MFWWTAVPNLAEEDLIPWILDKFARHGWWKAKHTSFDNIAKGTPKHMGGKVNESAEKLIKQNYLIEKPTGYGREVSLNFELRNEIFDLIEKWKIKR